MGPRLPAQAFAYNSKPLDQESIYLKLLDFKHSNLLFNDTGYVRHPHSYEKLCELLFCANKHVLLRLIHEEVGTHLKLWCLAYAYTKDTIFPHAVEFEDFSAVIDEPKCARPLVSLKILCSIAWIRHTVTNRFRTHVDKWLFQRHEGDDESLCNELLDSYDYHYMPVHSIIRIVHAEPRSKVIGAMFAWLTNNCTVEQFELLPESTKTTINFIKAFKND